MLETKSAGALVSGSGPSEKAETVTVKALRGFVQKGESHKAGDVVEVDEALAKALIGSNKAEAFEKPAKKGKK